MATEIELRWRKATRSADTASCVEQADLGDGWTAIRDSKSPGLGMHVVRRDVFDALLVDIKAGRLDP